MSHILFLGALPKNSSDKSALQSLNKEDARFALVRHQNDPFGCLWLCLGIKMINICFYWQKAERTMKEKKKHQILMMGV
jgi:hypothetical protein